MPSQSLKLFNLKSDKPYQICKRCILSTSDVEDITFDSEGICNFCYEYEKMYSVTNIPEEKEDERLQDVIKEIKKAGEGKQYDCICGISGGVDSTYLAYFTKKIGLRPLIVHYDNGWNSELAVKNIEGVLNRLDLDLYTYVNDWEEFRDIQLSFLRASVLDIELITDQAIVAILYKTARKFKIRHVITGHNTVTEGILPEAWYHWKLDGLNIRAIHNRFGKLKRKTYPIWNFKDQYVNAKSGKIKTVQLLNYTKYHRNEAKQLLMDDFDWKDYGGKHYESVFTRFYQGYILPVKFGIDKRKAHLSTMVCSGQISRKEALEMISKPPYEEQMLKDDKEYVIKKLGLTEEEFESIMRAPIKKHTDYPSYLTRHFRILETLSRITGRNRKK
ncbi:MAG: N-acetyl sugar amidotransferase [Bacteroidota bacterium]